MDYISAFKSLQKFSKMLNDIKYEKIVSTLNDINRIPIPLAKVHQNIEIDRARYHNGKVELFKSIDDLGYIKDKNIISNLYKFGRANQPHQVLFYGAIRTSQIPKPRATAILETSRVAQDPNKESLNGELFTVSRWRNREELNVIEVVFAEEALKNSAEVKNSFEKQISMFSQIKGADNEFNKDFLIFISEEFARKTKNHNDYKISTAYTELVFKYPDVQGITYPSVQTNYLGQNIALPTPVVDEFLYPEVCSTAILYKRNGKINIAPGEFYSKKLEGKIEWERLDEYDILK